jgi:hypothetical protein
VLNHLGHDSQQLAFLASQTPDGPMDVYVAGVVGSGQCPAGNRQRQLTQLASQTLGDLTWSADGDWVFFSDGPVLVVNVDNGETLPPITMPTGFGWTSAWRITRALTSCIISDDADLGTGKPAAGWRDEHGWKWPGHDRNPNRELFQRIEWNADGSYLLISVGDGVLLLGKESGISVQVVRGNRFPPQPAISPDGEFVTYINAGLENPAVPQVYVVDRLGESPVQVTHHGEGTIDDLVWAPG